MRTSIIGIGICLAISSPSVQGAIHRVQWDATGNNDGSSWVHAFVDLHSALAIAVSGDEIWVAAGTYKPTATPNGYFEIPDRVKVYGGFLGTNHLTLPAGETMESERNFAFNITTLSGDLNGDDTASFGNYGDNSATVVRFAAQSDNQTELDGFNIRGVSPARSSWSPLSRPPCAT